MGFTPWLYEASANAQTTTYDRLFAHGGIVKHHLQGGIPWQEALDQSDYHPNVESEINTRLNLRADGLEILLAIDSLNSGRDALSPYWAESDNSPLPEEWQNRSWSSIEVIDAYINFASDMIDRFQPLYFEYGTEISELILNDPDGYDDYLVFAEDVYSELKRRYPNLPLITSVALKSPNSEEMTEIAAQYAAILPYTDIVGISVYPYVFFSHSNKGDPANLPTNWLTQIQAFTQNKPLAISETGWIAKDLEISEFNVNVASNPSFQDLFANTLLEQANAQVVAFVIWWTVTDFDRLWENTLGEDPVAKIWKDIGLYDETQTSRPALSTWNEWLNRDKQGSP